jgi:hypothetical protein
LAHCPGEHRVLPATLARPLLNYIIFAPSVCCRVGNDVNPSFSIHRLDTCRRNHQHRLNLVGPMAQLISPLVYARITNSIGRNRRCRMKGTTNMKLTTCRMRPRAAKQGTKWTLRALVAWTRAQVDGFLRRMVPEPTISELTNRR